MPEFRDSRDLLQRFTSGDGGNNFPVKHELPENVELSLGLSLNGRFGLKPQKLVANDDNKLFRASSSVTDFVNFPVDVDVELSLLTRTCSLPVPEPETEAEWRKRKELQSLRRSEAKRKRFEKLKNVRPVKLKQSPPSPSPLMRFSSQGSIGSQGSGGSSGVSDLDSQPSPSPSPGTIRDTNETNEHSKLNNVICNPKTKPNIHCASDQTMPCVSTKGDGPDGKRVQGFLYKYGKGEDVRIVCVCHGSVLTPAEFVKHGGGGDVEHPLRHIVVTSSLFS